jgi:membrane-associated phospholipid phosphatase
VNDSKPHLIRTLVIGLALVALAFALDGWVFRHIIYRDVYGEDWGRLLRIMGFLPTWMAASAAMVLHEWHDRARRWRGTLITASAASGGIACEVLKLLLRRERPMAHDGEYVFRAFSERTFSTSGLAFPSSHTVVAFSAAAMLAHLFPRARVVWFALAAGCGLSRLLARAHFLSDVALAALVGILVAALLWRWYLRRFVPVSS